VVVVSVQLTADVLAATAFITRFRRRTLICSRVVPVLEQQALVGFKSKTEFRF